MTSKTDPHEYRRPPSVRAVWDLTYQGMIALASFGVR